MPTDWQRALGAEIAALHEERQRHLARIRDLEARLVELTGQRDAARWPAPQEGRDAAKP